MTPTRDISGPNRVRRAHSHAAGAKSVDMVDIPLVALDLRMSTLFGGIRLKTQLLVCHGVAHVDTFSGDFAISCK